MANKRYETTIDFTWSGETRIDTFLGKQITISSANEVWGTTDALWTDNVIIIIEYLLWGGSRGGVCKQWDTWDAWNKLNEKNKQKIINVIVYLKNGVKLENRIDVNKYKLTVKDVELLRNEYEKYKLQIENVKIL